MGEHLGHKITYQFLSAIYYFLKNECDAFTLEGKNNEDALFYKQDENEKLKLVAVGEAKDYSFKKWTLRRLFYPNKTTRGAITQLWKRIHGKDKAKPVFFTSQPIKKQLTHGRYLNVKESEIKEIIDKTIGKYEIFRKDFPEIKSNKNKKNIAKLANFINKIEYHHHSKQELFTKICSHLKVKGGAEPKIEDFMYHLNFSYSIGEIIGKEEFLLRVGMSKNPNVKHYYKALKAIAKTKSDERRFDLIKNRRITQVTQNKETKRFETQGKNGKSYTANDLINLATQIETTKKTVAIIGEMGIGKSTFALQIITAYLENYKPQKSYEHYYRPFDPLPFFIELRGLELSQDSAKDFGSFIQNYMVSQLTRNIEKLTETRHKFNKDENAMLDTIKQLLKIPTIIILDGFDEFKGKEEDVLTLLDSLVAKNHQIIITGRVHAFENVNQIENRFYSKGTTYKSSMLLEREKKADPWATPFSGIITSKTDIEEQNTLLQIFKLEGLNDNQVKSYMLNLKKITNTRLPEYESVRKLVPETHEFPELNFRNPLVLQAILTSLPKNQNEISAFGILEMVVAYSFKWYIVNSESFVKKLQEKSQGKKQEYNKELNKNILTMLEIHQKLSSCILLKDNKNLTDKITTWVEKSSIYYEPIKEFFLSNANVGFIQETKEEFHIIPDRIFDFFVVNQISFLLKFNKIKNTISLLREIIGNIENHQNLVRLFAETFAEELKESDRLFLELDEMIRTGKLKIKNKNDANEVFFISKKLYKAKMYTITTLRKDCLYYLRQ